MWDDIKIGEGEFGNSWGGVSGDIPTNETIMGNKLSYSISDVILDTSLYITRNSTEGEILAVMIDDIRKTTNRKSINKQKIKISKYLTYLVIDNAPTRQLIELIKYAIDEAFENGKQSIIDEYKKLFQIGR